MFKYENLNHVGSVPTVTNHEGTLIARYNYEPYRKRLAQSTGTGIMDYKYNSKMQTRQPATTIIRGTTTRRLGGS